jgi:hypothetical protein
MKAKPNRSRVTPDEFLTWAEQDIGGSGKRGIANALTNAERALHARIDEILYSVRVRYANDWPDKPITDLKLKALGRLNIPTTTVAKVLTEHRNDLEHAYILPSQQQVQFYVQTARLWLNDSKTYLHPPIVLAGLPIKSCVSSPYVKTKRKKLHVTFGSTEKILFFYDTKRKLIVLKSNGARSETSYKELKWKEMIRYQQPYFSDNNPLVVSSMFVASKIYRQYEQLVKRNRRAILIPYDSIMLEESDICQGDQKQV